jgi:hypothetical protein
MEKDKNRLSWTDTFQNEAGGIILNKKYLFLLDDILYRLWALGRNVILLCAFHGKGIEILVVPHYLISELTSRNYSGESSKIEAIIQEVVAGPKVVSLDQVHRIGHLLNRTPEYITLPFVPGEEIPTKTINSLIKRYGITLVQNRAVALFDIVGFSLYSPLEQVTQLNSLAYSVNTAYSKLLDRKIKINFARTTTGDGFYIWNRASDINANLDLYHFMHLVLADNAIARSKARSNTAPLLTTCFHVGGHYEFYQSEGLNPTTFSYIVGEVTIELARMISNTKPGQIIMGSFRVPMRDPETDQIVSIDTVNFIDRVQGKLSSLDGLVLSGDRIDSIKCYLTGSKRSDGSYNINQYRMSDKHGFTRNVFNAKVNIHRKNADPIFLGVQDSELFDLEISNERYSG